MDFMNRRSTDTDYPIRAALIGITGFGARHYAHLRELEAEGRVCIDAATIINRHEVPEEWNRLEAAGTRLYTDYRDMLEAERGRIDATFIPTGIAWHERMTTAALQAGSHVYLEKPAAATVAEVEIMIAARDTAGKKVAVGFQQFSDPALRKAKQLLLADELGPLQSVSVLGLWPRRKAYYARNAWAGKIDVDGRPVRDSPANNALSHFLILAMFLGSRRADEVAALSEIDATLLRAKPIESFDTLSLRGHFENQAAFNCQFTHSCNENHAPRIRVRGRDGYMDWLANGAFTFPNASPEIAAAPAKNLQKAALANFIESLRSDRPVDCSLEMALEHTRVIERLHTDFPILDVPENHIEHLNSPSQEDDELLHVPGIETLMTECFEDPSARRMLRPDDLDAVSSSA